MLSPRVVFNTIVVSFAVTIESEEDIREFVKAKIESLVAHLAADQDVVAETETSRFKSAAIRFHRIFNMPPDEELVNCMVFFFAYLTYPFHF